MFPAPGLSQLATKCQITCISLFLQVLFPMKLPDPKYLIKLLFHCLRFLTLPSIFLKGVSCIPMCRNLINGCWENRKCSIWVRKSVRIKDMDLVFEPWLCWGFPIAHTCLKNMINEPSQCLTFFIRPDDLRGIFWPKWFYEFMILLWNYFFVISPSKMNSNFKKIMLFTVCS